jgi:hypothetical protein
MMFDLRAAYLDHTKDAHGGNGCSLRPSDVMFTTCPQVVFACGFVGCRRIFQTKPGEDPEKTTLDFFCHVLDELYNSSGLEEEWIFSVEFENLMGQANVKDAWIWARKSGPECPVWDPRSSVALKKLLETRHVSNVSSFMGEVIRRSDGSKTVSMLPPDLSVPKRNHCSWSVDDHKILWPDHRVKAAKPLKALGQVAASEPVHVQTLAEASASGLPLIFDAAQLGWVDPGGRTSPLSFINLHPTLESDFTSDMWGRGNQVHGGGQASFSAFQPPVHPWNATVNSSNYHAATSGRE